jgi:hypothetical protein
MSHWVKTGIVENRFEGDRISQALEEAKIPFVIKSFHDTAYNGLYLLQKGWGAVLVPKDFRKAAAEIIAEVKKTFSKEEEEDEIGQHG